MIVNNKKDEAEEVLIKMARKNRRPLTENDVFEIRNILDTMAQVKDTNISKQSL